MGLPKMIQVMNEHDFVIRNKHGDLRILHFKKP